jgi:hypothetical protein
MWNISTRKVLKGNSEPVRKVVVVQNDILTLPDSDAVYASTVLTEKLVAYCTHKSNVSVWDLDDFELLWKFSPFGEDLTPVEYPADQETNSGLQDDGGGPNNSWNTDDDPTEVIEDLLVLEDWVVIRGSYMAKSTLVLVHKHKRYQDTPELSYLVTAIMKHDSWHFMSFHTNFSMCIWSGNQVLRHVTSRCTFFFTCATSSLPQLLIFLSNQVSLPLVDEICAPSQKRLRWEDISKLDTL